MGHLTTKDAYKNLEERINWFTQGAPPSDTLYKILQVLYTEKEAKWVAKLPVRSFSLKKAAKIWGTTEAKAEKLLDHLCEKALLVDSWHNGERHFVMPPPMAGFIEFALMRTRGDIDQKYLSELYYQYMDVEEDFVKDLFFATETRLGRVYVQEPVLTNDKTNHILDYERASHIIDEAQFIGVGTCYCRHKAYHAGHPCEIDAPWDVCLTFDNVARSLAEHGEYTRLISKEEAMDVLERSYDSNLVQIGENVREQPAFICNCCGCCCEALQAARRFSPMQPVATTNYIPEISADRCVGCGKCAKVCPILAISIDETEVGQEGSGKKKKKAVVDKEICLGCGVCARNCARGAIELKRRPVQIITPVNSTHRFVLQAIEKGTLQNLIFDNQAFSNHRAMAAVFGTILKLPPLKQALASKQLKSIYLDKLLSMQGKRIVEDRPDKG
ncbi:MAG: 4Fe-4S dicluster domain-containing protein [Lachnospiraceae bacterium]|nr:4Fe-4S dicluster domain-containing protein [Lachnospiraceae bacterium]